MDLQLTVDKKSWQITKRPQQKNKGEIIVFVLLWRMSIPWRFSSIDYTIISAPNIAMLDIIMAAWNSTFRSCKHWHILIWTACCNTCWLKACVANWSWRIWEWLLMGYNADHTHLSSNMSHDLYSLLWFTYECLLVVAVGRILFILK